MKSLTNILRRSKLTPLERVTALVHNKVQKEKTGKALLSDAEIKSIASLWTPRGNDEIRQFNKYIALMDLETTMKMEIQMYYAESDNGLLRSHRMVDYMRNYTSLEEFIERDQAKEHIPDQEVINYILEHSYLEYEHLVHTMTFYSLDADIQDDFEILDPHIRIDTKYISQEVMLYELLSGNNTSDGNTKKKLVSLLWNAMYSEKSRRKRNGTEKDGILIHHGFASIPVRQILYRCADYLSITVDTDDPQHINMLLKELQAYADNKGTSLELVIKPLLGTWIDDGLFVSTYAPIYVSNQCDTYEGVTKRVHKELFDIWYEAFNKTKTYLDELIASGEMKKELLNHSIKGNISIITAKSLYTSTFTIPCIDNMKEQIPYLVPVVRTFLFIKKCAYPVKSYATMNAFVELSQEFSKVFDIDLSEKYVHYRDEFQMQILMMNMNLLMLFEILFEYIHNNDNWRHVIEIETQAFGFDYKKEVEPEDFIEKYKEEFDKNK